MIENMKKSINVLVTGAGSPGIKGTVYSLKNNVDKRNVIVIGTDMNKDAVGQYICDKFHVIPSAKDREKYLKALLNICKKDNVAVLLPQNTAELEILANNRDKFKEVGTKVVVASEKNINMANDKYSFMKICKDLGVPVGDFYKVNTFDDLIDKAKNLGWPLVGIVVKPPISNGSRGVRIVSETIDRKTLFYNEKPNSLYTSMEGLRDILGDSFPDLIVTEYLPGTEYTVDVYRGNDNITVIPRIRHQVRSGITFSGETVQHEEIINYCKLLSTHLNLENCFGFQFKLDKNNVPKILESNPRIQGTMVLATLANANIIYASVINALGEKTPDLKVKWGTKFLRFWGGIGVCKTRTFI